MSLQAGQDRDSADHVAALEHPVIVLKSNEFRRAREASWLELEGVIDAVEKRGMRTLTRTSFSNCRCSIARHYRRCRWRARSRLIATSYDLENLALRAFLAVYSPPARFWASAGRFLRVEFPAAVRSARWHLLIASLALTVGLIVGFWLTVGDEAWFTTLVPSGLTLMGAVPAAPAHRCWRGRSSRRGPGLPSHSGSWPTFCSATTPSSASSRSASVWRLVLTILLLAYQGLSLGAFIALHYNRQLTADFLGWIAIHGVTEIGAVLLCGAAGLVLADKILFPDRYSRVDSLAMHGRARPKSRSARC